MKNFFTFIFILWVPIAGLSQTYEQLKIQKAENNEKKLTELQGLKYSPKSSKNVAAGITIGGDAVENSLRIEVYGDNIQVYRYTGGTWQHQWFMGSETTDPWKSSKLFVDGIGYNNHESSTVFTIDGVVDANPNSTYYQTFSSSTNYENIGVSKDDNYNATITSTKSNNIENVQTINYPSESDYINYQWEITNTGATALANLKFYSGGDTYSYGNDDGQGFWESADNTVGVTKETGSGETVNLYLQAFQTPYEHESAVYDDVKDHVNAGALTGTVTTTTHDNAIALEWRKATLAPGETWTLNTIEKFSNKEITDLTVTAPLNETISPGETKDIVFEVRNNSFSSINNIALNELIDLTDWTVNVKSPVGSFDLSSYGDIQNVTVEVYCPISAVNGDVAKAILQADDGSGTNADDKAYIQVLGSMPTISLQPADVDVCSSSEPATFSVSASGATSYQWQEYTSVWSDLLNSGVYSDTKTNTLLISDVTGLAGNQYRCIISNGSGDITSDAATINADSESPVISSTHNNTTQNANNNCEALLADYTGDLTATDNCSYTVSQIPAAGTVISSTTTVTLRAEDEAGNFDDVNFDVNIIDNTDPIIPSLSDLSDDCSLTAPSPTTTDACAGTITGTTSDPTTYNTQGTYTIEWTFDDGNGNSIVANQNVIVDDLSAPIPDILNLSDITAECEITTLTAPTAVDNCAGTLSASHDAVLPIGTSTTVTWTYEDGNGNSAEQTQDIIIDDVTAPIADLAQLGDIVGECSVSISGYPTATDNCSGQVIAATLDPTEYSEPGEYSITWIYTDDNGNSSSQNQTIIVTDDEDPVPNISNLPNITANCSTTITTIPTAIDNCSGEVTATTSDPLVYDMQGSYTIAWSYDDGNGNTILQMQAVIIDDMSAPVLNNSNLPELNAECELSVSEYPTADDECSGIITATTASPLFYNEEGSYLITWEFSDDNGNTITQEQIVSVENQAPNVYTQDLTITLDENDFASISPQQIDNGSYDNCGIDSLSLNKSNFSAEDIGDNEVMLTVTDIKGKTSSEFAVVTVLPHPEELEIPNFVSPDNNGKNDYWEINGISALEGYKLVIFNKIGEIIYETINYDNSWNATVEGKELPDGTYYYIFTNEQRAYKGFITVIR
ncbi:MAG: gliding motility-associated C-terminal domain-containing protein [Bacteroidota bacterium]|nr:gliding motility-associated C-terminal domain-containing protein [Bacteroidota bacterium]